RGQSKFSTWLHRIATNVTIDWIRRKQIAAGVEFDDTLGLAPIAAGSTTAPHAAPPPQQRLEAGEIRTRIDAALSQLSPEHRAVILLREVDGASYEEIAEATGCTLGTVMSRLFYARKKLQTLLRDLYDTL
ncbi:MAG: sigma-70 family RNA polymerase sigma factor, partial [Chthoniobacteraceae bacterium]|nr:sigma-70 family RNA polymerase sigma factor [Chthoniobacteraceae bacterium]